MQWGGVVWQSDVDRMTLKINFYFGSGVLSAVVGGYESFSERLAAWGRQRSRDQ